MGKHDVIEPKYFKAVGGKERESDRERVGGGSSREIEFEREKESWKIS